MLSGDESSHRQWNGSVDEHSAVRACVCVLACALPPSVSSLCFLYLMFLSDPVIEGSCRPVCVCQLSGVCVDFLTCARSVRPGVWLVSFAAACRIDEKLHHDE